MIISHEHKFIFIKTAKTAGTSIEVALREVCGAEDVITPFRKEKETHRGGRGPQNLELDHPAVPKRALWRRLLRRPERSWHPSVGYYSHMPAWRVRAYVGEEIWNDYFTFAFERNPWDRQVSHYHYKNKNKGEDKKQSFDEYLSNKRKAFVDNCDLYSQDGKVIVNFLGTYENIADDFAAVLKELGLDDKVSLPFVNRTANRQSDYQSYFAEETAQRVAEWYAPEIKIFGYRFEQNQPDDAYDPFKPGKLTAATPV
jgi:hypothetical protein